jgi:hypothetical protein
MKKFLFTFVIVLVSLNLVAQQPWFNVPGLSGQQNNERMNSAEGVPIHPWIITTHPSGDIPAPVARESSPSRFVPTSGVSDLDSLITAYLSQFRDDSLKSYILKLESFKTRFMLADNKKVVAEWLRKKFIAEGCDEAVLDSFQVVVSWNGSFDTTWQYNVIGTITGSVTPDAEYIYGGHYDAIIWNREDPMIQAYGADDNGSAIAATLETLRVFKNNNFRPRSTIRFVGFAAEELGLIGSAYYAYMARYFGINLKLMINLDMIGNERSASDWKVKVYKHPDDTWAADMTSYLAAKYTSLTPVTVMTTGESSDSYPFWYYGFTTTYLEEFDFSPNWHKITDTDSNMNFLYLRESSKAACATLMTACQAPARVNLMIDNPGDGSTLKAVWNKSTETGIKGYRVHVGKAPGIYDSVYSTTDTTYSITSLTKDSTYYIGVGAVNSEGTEGILSEKSDQPALVSLDQGILIVEDSKGALLSEADSTIKNYYTDLIANYKHSYFNAYNAEKIGLGDLGPYAAVIWAVNKSTTGCKLFLNKEDVSQYMRKGGKILFTLYQPSKAIENNTAYPALYPQGTFIRDFLQVDSIWMNLGNAFNEAIPVAEGYPDLHVDSLKIPVTYEGHLVNIEGLFPSAEGKIIYKYGTKFDSTINPGKMKNKPVGIEYLGPAFKAITLSFPLYYLYPDAAKTLVDYVMRDRFGVFPIGIEEPLNGTENISSMKLYPNPAGDAVELSYTLGRPATVSIRIVNAMGQTVYSSPPCLKETGNHHTRLNLSAIRGGLYQCILQTADETVARKFIVVK